MAEHRIWYLRHKRVESGHWNLLCPSQNILSKLSCFLSDPAIKFSLFFASCRETSIFFYHLILAPDLSADFVKRNTSKALAKSSTRTMKLILDLFFDGKYFVFWLVSDPWMRSDYPWYIFRQFIIRIHSDHRYQSFNQ